jgi:hypothetical protein
MPPRPTCPNLEIYSVCVVLSVCSLASLCSALCCIALHSALPCIPHSALQSALHCIPLCIALHCASCTNAVLYLFRFLLATRLSFHLTSPPHPQIIRTTCTGPDGCISDSIQNNGLREDNSLVETWLDPLWLEASLSLRNVYLMRVWSCAACLA